MDYEAKLETFYTQLPLTGEIVVDVGAHTGRHAVPLSKLVGMDGICYAFEPVPIVRQALAANIASLALNNIVIFPVALGEANRLANFNFIPNIPQESGLKKRVVYNAVPSEFQQIPVKVCRLDDVLPSVDNVKFIKMDVEGGEMDVLRGSIKILENSRPIVAFERDAAGYPAYSATPDEIFEIFSKRGYSVFSITGIRIENTDDFRRETTTQRFLDYIAFPELQPELAAILTAH